jgi:Tetratricopeptide repeat
MFGRIVDRQQRLCRLSDLAIPRAYRRAVLCWTAPSSLVDPNYTAVYYFDRVRRIRDTLVREFQTMDRLSGSISAHLALALLFLLTPLAGCQSDSDSDPVSVDQPAASSTVVAPDRESGSPYGQLSEVGDQIDSQNADAGSALPPFPQSGQRDVSGPQPVDARSPNFNVDPNRSYGDATAAPNSPSGVGGNGSQSAGEVFSISPDDAPRVLDRSERSAVPVDQNPGQMQENGDPSADAAPLPWGPSTPSPELDAVSQRAEQTVRQAFNLAERGALYSARAQFADALRMLTEALDLQRSTTAHTRALTSGLRALDEVNDFAPDDVRSQAGMNLQLIVDAHHTPVLKNRSLKGVSLSAAQRMYLTYAQEQLAAAGGDQSVSSLALYGLGKVCTAPSAMHGPRGKVDEGKAVVFYQSALVVDSQNFMAANELGVLLTRFGRWNDARTALEHAVATSGTPTSWRNLAVVCDKIGDQTKAVAARHQADLAVARLQKSGHGAANSKYAIEMVDPTTFVQMHSATVDAAGETSVAGNTTAPAQQPAVSTAAKPNDKSGFWPWNRK